MHADSTWQTGDHNDRTSAADG